MRERDAVLELFTENLPGKAAISAKEQLKALAPSLLKKAGLPFKAIETFATCRRLVLYISGVPARAGGAGQKRPAAEALRPVFAGAIAGLTFQKTMLWGNGSIPFARPLRGLLALYGAKTVPFSAAGLKVGRCSAGLSSRRSPRLGILSAERYFETLKKAGVLVKDAERLAALRRAVAGFAGRQGLRADMDEELLRETLYLVERPVCAAGRYPERFLRLPPELLRLVLQKQLKLFPLLGRGNRLTPFFLAVTDGIIKSRAVSAGFSVNLEARLRSTAFFYARDLSVESGTEKLTFSANLGASRAPADHDIRLRLQTLENLGF